MTDADAEHEAAVRDLVNERNRLREVLYVARVDRGDAGAEADFPGRQRDRFAQADAVAEARAINSRKSAL